MPGSGAIGRALDRAIADRRGALLPFLTSGFPDPEESIRLALAACEEGADALELGVPFSDPLADGPVIQETSRRALASGATLEGALREARRIRERHETPIVLMTYVNPVVRLGAERFAREAAHAGVDGVILVDLPPGEDPDLWNAMDRSGLDTITLVAPTTGPARLPAIAARARGFLYVVARLGVTGSGATDPGLERLLARCREHTPLPRCVGFGLGASSDLTRLRGLAEGVIVGSSLLSAILAESDPSSRERAARQFLRSMRARLPDLVG
ncbi:MAG TPA: tryptophan synthase subunit alpha [Candidatus Eisenbacteria bacterium]|nr:tryptophan synthase subunit alpha [Candidatus Eisenbacteria bacterium]